MRHVSTPGAPVGADSRNRENSRYRRLGLRTVKALRTSHGLGGTGASSPSHLPFMFSSIVALYSSALARATWQSSNSKLRNNFAPVDPRAYIALSGLALAHFFPGRFEAVRRTRQILAEWPSHNISRRYLAAALGHLGRLEEAQAVIAELLRSQPNSCLTRSRQSGYRHQWMLDLYIDGLELSGSARVTIRRLRRDPGRRRGGLLVDDGEGRRGNPQVPAGCAARNS